MSFLLLSGAVLTSCGGGSETEDLLAKGGKKYGGEFKFMSQEKITNLFPAKSADLYSMRVISQLFETLVTIDQASSKVVPAIAESFEVSDDATVYTFKIRKGIKFHVDDCLGSEPHELNAEDVKFSLDYACSGLKDNQVAYILTNKIKGAQEFFNKSKSSLPKTGVSGIKVVNDYTLEITLIEPMAGFESVLTHASLGVSPREAYDKYGKDISIHPVGSGPFQLESYADDKIVLKRNPNYWQKDEFGNQLPFLSKIELTYAKDKRSEIMAFREKSIDMVLEIPVEEIDHILGTLQEAQDGKNVKHKVDAENSLSMMYIAMACESDEFKDVRVRKAFNLAVDREAIVDNWLDGEGEAAIHGFVPAMPNYPAEKVKGFAYSPEKAKALMAEAGYPNGKNFPALDFYVNTVEGSATHKTCQAVAQQIKDNLGVDLKIKLCELSEREAAIQAGTAKIWRSGWIADYPDPENFLTQFYGGNISDNATMVNSFRFRNEAYDKLFAKAQTEVDPEKRISLLLQCDQMVIDQAATMPILTDDHIVMLNARIRDFKASPLENLNLTRVYIKEPKEEKAEAN